MRSVIVTGVSLAMTAAVLTNAYLHKKQFYPSVVYITKSSPSMAVLYIQALVLVVLLGKMMRQIFFSQLRSAEMEHLIERSWYAVTETCLAFTVFRDDFSPRFVALFTVLLFLKSFHWLAEDRIDYMERSPVITWLFHLRAVSLLVLLGLLDAFFIDHAYDNTLIKGPSVQLVFGFEYAVLFTVVIHIFIKYVLHTIDLQNENPWENKAVFLLHAELLLGFIKCILYFLFLAIMIKVHTFPLFVIRPMYMTIREFRKALNDVVMSRRAIRNMNTLYPDATPEELASGDNVCIICREEMRAVCKKLPCNHIFHTSCLRSWFQRQQTCPTCRMDVLRQPAANAHPIPQPAPAAPHAAPGAAVPPAAAAAGGPQQAAAATQMFAAGWPPTQQFPAGWPTAPHGATAPAQPPPWMMMPPQMMMPPPMMMPPWYSTPMPRPPLNLAGLSVEELRRLEGDERQNIAARLQSLQDINVLLTAAVTQIQQLVALSQHTGYTATTAATASATAGPPAYATATTAAATPGPQTAAGHDSPVTEGAVGGYGTAVGAYGAAEDEGAAMGDEGAAGHDSVSDEGVRRRTRAE